MDRSSLVSGTLEATLAEIEAESLYMDEDLTPSEEETSGEDELEQTPIRASNKRRAVPAPRLLSKKPRLASRSSSRHAPAKFDSDDEEVSPGPIVLLTTRSSTKTPAAVPIVVDSDASTPPASTKAKGKQAVRPRPSIKIPPATAGPSSSTKTKSSGATPPINLLHGAVRNEVPRPVFDISLPATPAVLRDDELQAIMAKALRPPFRCNNCAGRPDKDREGRGCEFQGWGVPCGACSRGHSRTCLFASDPKRIRLMAESLGGAQQFSLSCMFFFHC